MNEPSCRNQVRLAELVATLLLGTDLGLGQPMEHVLRQCLIALRMSERLSVRKEVASSLPIMRPSGQHVR
jgi:hypothetical protein